MTKSDTVTKYNKTILRRKLNACNAIVSMSMSQAVAAAVAASVACWAGAGAWGASSAGFHSARHDWEETLRAVKPPKALAPAPHRYSARARRTAYEGLDGG
eukprot:scaffold13513_cov130-Isochrysis_galbana.AAC.3